MTFDDTSASNTATTYFYKVVANKAQGSSCGNNEIAARYRGESSGKGIVVAADPSGDQTGAPANPDLDIETLSVAEPGVGPNAGKLVFTLKVGGDPSATPNRMWRIIWNSPNAPEGQFYVGMTNDSSGAITYEYGTVATQVVGLVLGVQSTTKVGNADAGSFTPDGVITIAVSRNKVGNPQAGDVLGALTARTFPAVSDTIRSTAASDSTAGSTGNDNNSNSITYAVVGTEGPSQLLNISTRLNVQTGDNALIAGFIITGSEAKRIVVRGIGPSLLATGGGPFPNRLENPTLELYDPSGALITANDDWKETQQAEIEASRLAPTNDLEAAIVRTLNPGAYTAIVRGKNGTTGVGLAEAYDISGPTASKLANISTRGIVTAQDEMIGGFIVGPQKGLPMQVLVRAIGPSLGEKGVPGTLADSTLGLYDANGTALATNDDWQMDQGAAISATGIPPSNPAESAILRTVTPGTYTAILRGKNGTSGIALVEVYALP